MNLLISMLQTLLHVQTCMLLNVLLNLSLLISSLNNLNDVKLQCLSSFYMIASLYRYKITLRIYHTAAIHKSTNLNSTHLSLFDKIIHNFNDVKLQCLSSFYMIASLYRYKTTLRIYHTAENSQVNKSKLYTFVSV